MPRKTDSDGSAPAAGGELDTSTERFTHLPVIAGAGALGACGATALVLWAVDAGADTWMAAAAWLTVIVAIGAAVVTLLQVAEGRRRARSDERDARAREERERQHALQEQTEARRLAREIQERQADVATKLQIEELQPSVVVFSEPNRRAKQGAVDLVIRNVGRTPAYDVRVVFDPHPKSLLTPGNVPEDLLIPKVLPTLAPGQEWRTIWDTLLERQRAGDDAPNPHTTATASFTRHGGAPPIGGPWVYELDLEVWRRTTITEHGTHEAVEALRKLAKHAEGWSRSSKAINVVARDGDRLDQRREQARAQRERHLERREAGEPATGPWDPPPGQ